MTKQIRTYISQDNHGVSTVIGSILIILIVIASIAIVLSWGMPYIENKKLDATKNTAFGHLNKMVEDTINIVREGYNNSAVINKVQVQNSYLSLNSSIDRFVICYSINDSYNFNVSNLDDDGEFIITMNDFYRTNNLAQIELYYMEDDPFVTAPSVNPKTLTIGSGITQNGNDFNINPSIGTSFSIKGTVIMNLSSSTAIFGKIIIFDLGNIEYKIESSQGYYRYIIENGCIISSENNINNLMREPLFFSTDNITSFRIIQTRAANQVIGGGTRGYMVDVKTKLIYSDVKELLQVIYNMTIDIYGDYSDVWFDYLENTHYFIMQDENTISHFLYGTNQEVIFMLAESIIQIS